MEIWKPVEGYENMYEISNYGRVKSLSRKALDGRVLKESIIKGGYFGNGYQFVCLRKNGMNKNYLVHRLVAKAFVPNEHQYPNVNHIDGVKTNNHHSNLEWCTQSYNLRHAIKIGLVESQCKIRREVVINNGDCNIVFESMKGCASFFGFKKGWLHNRLRKFGNNFNYNGWKIKVLDRGNVWDG